MEFDVSKRTILKVKHGSHAYGLNVPTSDEDFKGVCIKPREFYFGCRKFEQAEHMGSKSDGVDSVIYSIDKFVALALDCNPNIIEVLHVADSDVLVIDEFGEELRERRNDFISKKARFTFSGYAHAQLKRIKTHRAWLLNPPVAPPTREEFGLPTKGAPTASELGAFVSLEEKGQLPEVPKHLVTLFVKEKAFRAECDHYAQFKSWEKSRNPARAELEAKFGMDTKHAMHLVRLMRMCVEILDTGIVNVKRHDRDELLAVRYGKMSYDELIEHAECLEKKADELYVTSKVRKEPDRKAMDRWLVDLTDRYLRKYG